MKISEYLKISEAANFLGIAKGTLRNWDNLIPCYRNPLNNFRIYKKADLEEFLKTLQTFKGQL